MNPQFITFLMFIFIIITLSRADKSLQSPNLFISKLLPRNHLRQQRQINIKSDYLNYLHSMNDSSGNMTQRRLVVKEMMIHAWNNYVKYAWGENELNPQSRTGSGRSIFGRTKLGLTIVDSMDTLFIMGLNEAFKKGREWIAQHFSLDNININVSVFEMNIRFVGGLLSSFALTKDDLFLKKAVHVADKLLPAFNTPTGIPFAEVNLKGRLPSWLYGPMNSVLAEVGSLHLEFVYLSNLTNNSTYKEKVMRTRQVLKSMGKPYGHYYNYLNPVTGHWRSSQESMGAQSDSFYEYLLKSWIQSNQTDIEARQMYDEAIDGIVTSILRTSPSGLLYLAEMEAGGLIERMQHLACFAGGLFALGGRNSNEAYKMWSYQVGERLTETCHESYRRAKTGLGPEFFRFIEGKEAMSVKNRDDPSYPLRPEVVESYFYMWRLTKDSKYRDWAWDVVIALETYCKTSNGYSGLLNVYNDKVQRDDLQQSYFLAETLKYLYLIFSEDNLLSLDEWVFNTEGHPLPIQNYNPNNRYVKSVFTFRY